MLHIFLTTSPPLMVLFFCDVVLHGAREDGEGCESERETQTQMNLFFSMLTLKPS